MYEAHRTIGSLLLDAPQEEGCITHLMDLHKKVYIGHEVGSDEALFCPQEGMGQMIFQGDVHNHLGGTLA